MTTTRRRHFWDNLPCNLLCLTPHLSLVFLFLLEILLRMYQEGIQLGHKRPVKQRPPDYKI